MLKDAVEDASIEGKVVVDAVVDAVNEEEADSPDSIDAGGAGSVDSGVESPRNSASPEPRPIPTTGEQDRQSDSAPSYAKATRSFKEKQRDAVGFSPIAKSKSVVPSKNSALQHQSSSQDDAKTNTKPEDSYNDCSVDESECALTEADSAEFSRETGDVVFEDMSELLSGAQPEGVVGKSNKELIDVSVGDR